MAARRKQSPSLDERLLRMAEDCRARARILNPGKEQDELLDKARQFETQIRVNSMFSREDTRARV
jgi:hypothetical protein